MSQNNSTNEAARNYFPELFEQQDQVPYSPNNTSQTEISEEEYQAMELEEEERFHSQESESESDSESDSESRSSVYFLDGVIDFADSDEEIEDLLSSINNNVDDLLHTSSYVDINSLGPDDLKCVICHSEYSNERENNTTEPAVEEANQDSPDRNTAECPIKLPCNHVFGNLCIRRWFQDSPSPTCPICRYRL